MPDKPADPDPSETHEVRTIRHLVRLMHRYDLTAIDLDEGSTRIRLRRRGAEVVHAPLAAPPPVLPPPTMAATAPAEPAPPPAPRGVVIESPMVGTFYSSSAPDAPPFVNVGSTVRADSTVCVIEAMKVFTDIPAGVAGTITEILVKNGQSVEYGQPLFRVDPS